MQGTVLLALVDQVFDLVVPLVAGAIDSGWPATASDFGTSVGGLVMRLGDGGLDVAAV
ncbi:hypothetical protein [Spongiactinospora sp. 9N601]|uniref:hypothetical protein n=1 Tax=Spongiactinospora sp. 9N601 TaxID=3375149 RepID=UPI0037A0BD55